MTDTEDERDHRIRQLTRSLQHREYEIRMLRETATAVGGELGLQKVLDLVAERARELIDAETLLIPILDRECSSYTYRAGCGRDADEIVGETLPLEYGICGWVWRHKRPWWRGVLEELDETERNRWEQSVGTVIMVPLVGKQHFLGGIAGFDKRGGGDFTERDLDLLTLFASQVAVAIENALAYYDLAEAKRAAEIYQSELAHLNAELVKINRQLEQLALYDQLTQLPNRSLLRDRLQQAISMAGRANQSLAVLILDLDEFKEINDTLGHDAGDSLLQEVAERFRRQLRDSDTVGRLGGDEFAVLVPGADAQDAVLVASHLLRSLEAPFELQGNRLAIGSSVGIALYPEHGTDVSQLLKSADMAMYEAKRSRSGYCVFDSRAMEDSPGRLTLMNDLRVALREGQFELYYQPKVDLASGHIVGAEALTRWNHPQRGLVAPDAFIPALEQTGLIRAFTRWVVADALRQSCAWQAAGLSLDIAVNLSMENLLDPDFPEQVWALLNDCCPTAKPGPLTFEITESVFFSERQHVMDFLEQLRRRGISLSIDDFGTGHSSLSRLKRLPVNELKIDRSFVADMEESADDAVIVRSTIELAHNLGMVATAEGVENEILLEMLAEYGCDHAQGFYLGRPLPVPAFERFVRDHVPLDLPRAAGRHHHL